MPLTVGTAGVPWDRAAWGRTDVELRGNGGLTLP